MSITPIKIGGRHIPPHKAVVSPNLEAKNVLTDEPWNFVALSLRREKKKEALFYWEQGYEFHRAAQGLPTQSAPLLHYYSFMNATKALLTARGRPFDRQHGVNEWHGKKGSRRLSLSSVGVQIKERGVLPALSLYYGETESQKQHTLQELLFNLPSVHRTYCLTYTSQRDMFIPLLNCKYVIEQNTRESILLGHTLT